MSTFNNLQGYVRLPSICKDRKGRAIADRKCGLDCGARNCLKTTTKELNRQGWQILNRP